MGFKLSAEVFAPKVPSYLIERTESLGIWEGKEIFNKEDCPEGLFNDIKTQFERMQKKGKAPVTFTWVPPQNKLRFFETLKWQNSKFSIVFFVQKRGSSASWILNFTEVDVFRVIPRRGFQRVEATYKGFYPA